MVYWGGCYVALRDIFIMYIHIYSGHGMIWACVKMLFQPRINGGTYWVYYKLKCHMVVSENGDSSNLIYGKSDGKS